MIEMRKKLYDLLMSCGKCDRGSNCLGCEYGTDEQKCDEHLTNIILDDLLKARVVILPVKPDDTVYTISYGKVKEWKVYYIGMNSLEKFTFYFHDEDLQNSRGACDEDLGKTVFLTEEDAINELKERRARDRT